MKLSTSTNLIAFRPDYVSYFPILDSMKRLKAVGFDAVDLNVSDAGQPFFRLGDDDWKEWMQEVADLSQELNLPITQSHAPFYNALEPESKKAPLWEQMIPRHGEGTVDRDASRHLSGRRAGLPGIQAPQLRIFYALSGVGGSFRLRHCH